MSLPRVLSASSESSTRIAVLFDQAMNPDVELTDISNYSVSPAIPSFSSSTVSVVTPSSVEISLPINMLGGQEYEIDVSQQLTNAGLEVLNFEYTSARFVGVGDDPSINSAVATTNSTITIVFSEPMQLLELSDPGNFYSASRNTGRRIPITSSSPVQDGDGFYRSTILGISSAGKMTNSGLHLLEARGLFDVVGNGGSTYVSEFVGIADLPTVLSSMMFEEERVLRVTFDSAMSETWATAPGALSITSTDPGVPSSFYSRSELSDDGTVLSLWVSELRIGAPYIVRATNVVQDEYGNAVNPGLNSFSFTGVGNIPVLDGALSVGRNRMNLSFSENIRDNPQSRDVTRYTSDNGLVILSVLEVVKNEVWLVTTDQISGQTYTITVT